jgi:hypothetical protein
MRPDRAPELTMEESKLLFTPIGTRRWWDFEPLDNGA